MALVSEAYVMGNWVYGLCLSLSPSRVITYNARADITREKFEF